MLLIHLLPTALANNCKKRFKMWSCLNSMTQMLFLIDLKWLSSPAIETKLSKLSKSWRTGSMRSTIATSLTIGSISLRLLQARFVSTCSRVDLNSHKFARALRRICQVPRLPKWKWSKTTFFGSHTVSGSNRSRIKGFLKSKSYSGMGLIRQTPNSYLKERKASTWNLAKMECGAEAYTLQRNPATLTSMLISFPTET